MATTYECETCGQGFKRIYNLQRHHRTQHWQNERVIAVCDVCGKVFSRLDNMRRHRKVHDQPKVSKVDCNKENEQDLVGIDNESNDRKRPRVGDHNDEQLCKKVGISFEIENELPIVNSLMNWRMIPICFSTIVSIGDG